MTKSPDFDQVRIFAGPEDGAVLAWQVSGEEAKKVQAVTSDEVGPSTSVAQRAERLVTILNVLAHRNMIGGFNIMSADEAFREQLEERYKSGTDFVIDNSLPLPDRLHLEARKKFYEATDFESLRGHGEDLDITRGDVRITHEHMWTDFHDDRFGSPAQHKDLDRFRRIQEKFLPANHPLRQENRRGKNQRAA